MSSSSTQSAGMAAVGTRAAGLGCAAMLLLQGCYNLRIPALPAQQPYCC
jgi:hypothetical protein